MSPPVQEVQEDLRGRNVVQGDVRDGSEDRDDGDGRGEKEGKGEGKGEGKREEKGEGKGEGKMGAVSITSSYSSPQFLSR